MADIRRNQGKLQEAHESSRTVTRSAEMKVRRGGALCPLCPLYLELSGTGLFPQLAQGPCARWGPGPLSPPLVVLGCLAACLPGLGASAAGAAPPPSPPLHSLPLHSAQVLREEMQADVNAVSKAADGIKKRLADLDKTNEAAAKRKVLRGGADGTGTAWVVLHGWHFIGMVRRLLSRRERWLDLGRRLLPAPRRSLRDTRS